MVNIRIAVEQDFSKIAGLIKNELGYPKLNETEITKRLLYFKASDDWETFVAEENGLVCGFIGTMKGMAYNIDGYYAEIVALAVSNETRRKGIGSLLIKTAEAWAISHNIYEVGLHINLKRIDAHQFYEKNGYYKKSYWFYKSLGE